MHDDPRRSHYRQLTRAQQREMMTRTWGSLIPLLVVPYSFFAVDDSLTSSVLLSIGTGSSTLIMALQDYIHFRIKGEWLEPRFSTPLVVAGAVAMLTQVVIYFAGVQGFYYIPLQFIVMAMFIHCGLREWKRWF